MYDKITKRLLFTKSDSFKLSKRFFVHPREVITKFKALFSRQNNPVITKYISFHSTTLYQFNFEYQ